MVLAARGSRDMDDGVEPLGDDALASALKRKALRIHLLSLSGAAGLTALWMILPPLWSSHP